MSAMNLMLWGQGNGAMETINTTPKTLQESFWEVFQPLVNLAPAAWPRW